MRLKPPPPPVPVFRYRSPPTSGNRINGVGEQAVRQATPVFHRAFGRPPHAWTALDLHFNLISGMDGPLFGWGLFIERVRNLWQLRRANGPVAPVRRSVTDAVAMSAEVTARARQIGGDCLVGFSRITRDAVVAGEVVPYTYAISIGAPMNRTLMINAPEPVAGWEVLSAYRRVARIAVELSEQIRAMGWPAKAYGDTKTGELLHIPVRAVFRGNSRLRDLHRSLPVERARSRPGRVAGSACQTGSSGRRYDRTVFARDRARGRRKRVTAAYWRLGRYLGLSRLTIWSATSRTSVPTISGVSPSGNNAFPGRATKAAAQPARMAPRTSHAWAATRRNWDGATCSSVATRRYTSAAGLNWRTASTENTRSK